MGLTRLPEGLERFQKKGKSSEFNPKNYEHVKSSPSLKVWSHESVKDTVKFDKWVNLRGAKKYQKKILRSDGRWFGDAKDTIDTTQLKNHVYLLRFGHTKALLLKKNVTRNSHFSRPAETDPYVNRPITFDLILYEPSFFSSFSWCSLFWFWGTFGSPFQVSKNKGMLCLVDKWLQRLRAGHDHFTNGCCKAKHYLQKKWV